MAQGAVLGAQGNSGGIIAQVLCGLADAFDGLVEADGAALVAGLRSACDAAYAAVPEPVEGTMLTVVRAAAEAAEQLPAGDRLDIVVGRGGHGGGRRAAAHPRAAGRAGQGRRGGCRRPGPAAAAGRAGRRDHAASRSSAARSGRRRATGTRWRPPGRPAARSSATRCSTCCTPRSRRWPRCGPAWASSVTRCWWSAPATACTTCTSTSMTSARRSRPASRRAVRTGSPWSGSPTRSPPSRTRRPGPGWRCWPSRPGTGWPSCSAPRASS